MSISGRLLNIRTKKFGVKCALDPRQNVVNVSIEKGTYLIVEEVCSEDNSFLFIEILYKNSLVLLNFESIKDYEIL